MLKGQKHSEETIMLIKMKIREAIKNGYMGNKHPEETKEKIRRSIKKWWKNRKSASLHQA